MIKTRNDGFRNSLGKKSCEYVVWVEKAFTAIEMISPEWSGGAVQDGWIRNNERAATERKDVSDPTKVILTIPVEGQKKRRKSCRGQTPSKVLSSTLKLLSVPRTLTLHWTVTRVDRLKIPLLRAVKAFICFPEEVLPLPFSTPGLFPSKTPKDRKKPVLRRAEP